MKSTSLFLGTALLLIVGSIALLAPVLPLQNPQLQNIAEEFAAPTSAHLLGLGENGVDVLSQVFWGARTSLSVAFGSVFFAALIGLFLGSLSAYRGGFFDIVLMRLVDIVYAFPGILLVVALAFILGPSLRNMIFVMILSSWASYARLARAQTLSLRERDYVQSAIAVGSGTWRVLLRHIWPNLLAPLTVQMTYGMGAAILTESSLSFLGLGAAPGTPSWGVMLSQGRDVMTTATHLVIAPGIFLLTSVLAFNFLGDGLRDFFDPKYRS